MQEPVCWPIRGGISLQPATALVVLCNLLPSHPFIGYRIVTVPYAYSQYNTRALRDRLALRVSLFFLFFLSCFCFYFYIQNKSPFLPFFRSPARLSFLAVV